MNARTRTAAFALVLAISLPFATACSSGASTVEETPETVEETKEEEVKLTEDDVKVTEEAPATEQTAATKRVGADGVGYVTIPDSWVEFQDVDGNSSIQWCDGTPYTIISLNTFDMSTVPEDQRADFNVEDAANAVWTNKLNDGLSDDAVQGARVTLANRDALQVYALYPDGTYLVCWLLDDGNGTIRYVSAEGPESTIYDTVDMVQNTYEL